MLGRRRWSMQPAPEGCGHHSASPRRTICQRQPRGGKVHDPPHAALPPAHLLLYSLLMGWGKKTQSLFVVWRKGSGEAPTSCPHCHPVSLKSSNIFLCRFLALGGTMMPVGRMPYLSTSPNAEHLGTLRTSPALVPMALLCGGTHLAEDEG